MSLQSYEVGAFYPPPPVIQMWKVRLNEFHQVLELTSDSAGIKTQDVIVQNLRSLVSSLVSSKDSEKHLMSSSPTVHIVDA